MTTISVGNKKIEITEDINCTICLDRDPQNPPTAKLLPCGHSYHYDCIYAWLKIRTACPLDNQRVSLIQRTGADANIALPPALLVTPFHNLDFQNASMDEVNAILQGPVLEDHRGRAVIKAVENGRLDIVQALLQGQISEAHRGFAVTAAVQNGYLPILQTLLQGQISQQDRGLAVMNGSIYGRLDFVQALLQNNPLISEDHRGLAIWEAVVNNDIATVEELLENGHIPENLAQTSIVEAASRNRFGIVRLLLRNGPIPIETRNWLVKLAVEKGNLFLLKDLLRNGPISEKTRIKAFGIAARKCRPDIATALLRPKLTLSSLAVYGAIGAVFYTIGYQLTKEFYVR